MAWGTWSQEYGLEVWNCNTSWDSDIQFRIQVYWKYRQDLENNKTEINIPRAVFIEQRQLCLSGCTATFEIGFAGNTQTNSVVLIQDFGPPYNAGVTINKSQVVSNNSDGKCPAVPFVWRCSINSTDKRAPTMTSLRTYGNANDPTGVSDGKYGNYYNSIYTSAVPQLLLKSSISGGTGTMDSAVNLTVDRRSSSYTHTVTWKFGNQSGTICTKSSNTSLSWTPDASVLGPQIPNSTSGTVTYTITTYSGNSSLGSDTLSATLSIPGSAYPTSTGFTITDNNSVCDDMGIYVQSKSDISLLINAAGVFGSTIKTISTTFDGKTLTGASIQPGIINGSGEIAASTKITDSRNRSITRTVTIPVYAYSAPKITQFNVERCSENGTSDSDGVYAKCNFAYSITSLDTKNQKKYQVRLAKLGTSASDLISEHSLSVYSGNATNITAKNASGSEKFDVSTAYYLQIAVTDSFGTAYATAMLDTSYTLINFGADGKSIALMKASANAGEFECNMPTRHYKGSYVHSVNSNISGSGYFKLMTINIISSWANMPLVFKVIQRGCAYPTEVALSFLNQDTNDPEVNKFYRSNNAIGEICLAKQGTGSWTVYLRKSEDWDQCDIIEMNTSSFIKSTMDITLHNEFVASLPSEYITAELHG